ncbi:MAG: two-component system response regulator, partial [Candidatus Sericytochromatia bacterium]
MTPSSNANYEILVIDDDPYILDVFDLMGETLPDCRIRTAVNYRKAQELMEVAPLHLVLVDTVFGDNENEGLRILSELRKHPHGSKAYYILMSAHKHGLVDRMRAYHLGAQDFISKPFEIRELELMLQSKLTFFRNLTGPPQSSSRRQQVGKFCLDHALKRLEIDG